MTTDRTQNPTSTPRHGRQSRHQLAEQRFAAGHIPVQLFPDILLAIEESRRFVNEARDYMKLEPIVITTNNVKLVPRQTYHPNPLFSTPEDTSEALFDTYSRVGFVKFDKELYQCHIHYLADVVYSVVHEIMHAGAEGEGLAKYSFHLNEGMIDDLSRGALEQRVFPKLRRGMFAKDNEDIFARLLNGNHSRDGFTITPNDIFLPDAYFNPNSPVSGLYTYFKQTQIVNAINRSSPRLYTLLLSCLLQGNGEGARRYIRGEYGTEFADLLAKKDDAPLLDLLVHLNSR